MVKANKFNAERAVKTSFKEEFATWLKAIADSGQIETPIDAGAMLLGIENAIQDYMFHIWNPDAFDCVLADLQEVSNDPKGCIHLKPEVYRAVGVQTPAEVKAESEQIQRDRAAYFEAKEAEKAGLAIAEK